MKVSTVIKILLIVFLNIVLSIVLANKYYDYRKESNDSIKSFSVNNSPVNNKKIVDLEDSWSIVVDLNRYNVTKTVATSGRKAYQTSEGRSTNVRSKLPWKQCVMYFEVQVRDRGNYVVENQSYSIDQKNNIPVFDSEIGGTREVVINGLVGKAYTYTHKQGYSPALDSNTYEQVFFETYYEFLTNDKFYLLTYSKRKQDYNYEYSESQCGEEERRIVEIIESFSLEK